MPGLPTVVVCTTRTEAFAGVQRAFRPQGLAARTAATSDALVALLADAAVYLVLIDVHDRRLDLDGVLDVVAGSGTSRFLPVLILGGGERAALARQRLGSQIAVRTLDLEAVRDPQASVDHAEFGKAALRRHARVPIRLRVRMTDVDRPGTEAVGGQTHDLSEEGVGVVAPACVPIGHRVRVDLTLPDEHGTLRLDAQVRRTAELSGGGWFLGLWFPSIPAAVRARLRAFVERETGQGSQDGPPPS